MPIAALLIALLLAACGGAALPAADRAVEGADPSPAAETPTSADPPEVTAGPFPVAIQHQHGETILESEPERIVTVGLTDHDAFLALGVTPVGVTDWFGDQPHATWPWARDELGDAEPEIVGTPQELDFERIAALEPDVIVGLYAAMDEQTYGMLSEIAPTVAQPGDHVDYGIPWQELTRTVGRIVGEPERADALVGGIEERFATIRDEHPEFVGASAAIATPFEGIYVYSFEVANGRVLASLGFELPGEFVEMIGDADGTALSLERVELLDTDVLVWLDAVPDEGPLANDLYRSLDVHREGRELFVASSSELGGAMSFSSVLSLPFLLDGLVPKLEAAIDGDPGTTVEPAA